VSDGATVYDSGKVAATSSAHTLPADTLVNAVAYQWKVRTWDNQDAVGAYSALGSFETSAKPTVSITDPATNGDDVATDTYEIDWSFSDPESQGQSAYKVVLKIGGSTVHDSGKVASVGARTYGLTGLVNNTTYTVEVIVWDAKDVASSVATRTFDVAYTPVQAPTITVTNDDANARMTVVIDNPAVTGGASNPVSNDLYRREVGEVAWERIETGIAVDGTYHDYAVASGVSYEYKAKAFGVNGTSTDSVSVSDTLTLAGVWLHDPADVTGTIANFRYDGEGKDARRSVSMALHHFAGRTGPVAEFGEEEDASVAVRVGALRSGDDIATLDALIARRTVLCYRDGRGRKMFGAVQEQSHSDETWGASVTFQVQEVAYSEAV
jgi:hypothetical protein